MSDYTDGYASNRDAIVIDEETPEEQAIRFEKCSKCVTGRCDEFPDCLMRKCPKCGKYFVNLSGNCVNCNNERVSSYIGT